MKKFFTLGVFLFFVSVLFVGVGTRDAEAGEAPPDDCLSIDCNIFCPGGGDDCFGTPEDDVICGSNDGEEIFAGKGDDVVCGYGGSDIIHGGFGCDCLDGGTGGDEIHGGWGADLLQGGDDNDTIHAGQCDDSVHGQDGTDFCTGGQGDDSIQTCEPNTNLGKEVPQTGGRCDCTLLCP